MAESADGVPLWWELQGKGPVVALLPGRGDSSDLFPLDLSDLLIEAGLSVLRLDPRDTGLSGDGGDTYTLTTMAEDVVAVLDAAEVREAHLFGVSMGGMILVGVLAHHPTRVASATFLAAMSPDPTAGIGERFFAALDADPVEATLAAMGSPTPDDREWVAAEHRRAQRRAADRPAAGQCHQDAAFRLGWPGLARLAAATVPALVIHGSADHVLPAAHAEAFVREIPSSHLEMFDGMGHLPTRAEWRRIANLCADHIMRAEQH
jgi:3-oxoadipate enol-lactonase